MGRIVACQPVRLGMLLEKRYRCTCREAEKRKHPNETECEAALYQGDGYPRPHGRPVSIIRHDRLLSSWSMRSQAVP